MVLLLLPSPFKVTAMSVLSFKLSIFQLIMFHLLFRFGSSYYRFGATRVTASTRANDNKLFKNGCATTSKLQLVTGPFKLNPELEEMNAKLSFTTEPTTTLTAFSESSEKSIITSLTVSSMEMIFRSDLMGILYHSIVQNIDGTIVSSLLHNEMIVNFLLQALALYGINILFIIFF